MLAPVLKAEVNRGLGLEECRQTSFLMELNEAEFYLLPTGFFTVDQECPHIKNCSSV